MIDDDPRLSTTPRVRADDNSSGGLSRNYPKEGTPSCIEDAVAFLIMSHEHRSLRFGTELPLRLTLDDARCGLSIRPELLLLERMLLSDFPWSFGLSKL